MASRFRRKFKDGWRWVLRVKHPRRGWVGFRTKLHAEDGENAKTALRAAMELQRELDLYREGKRGDPFATKTGDGQLEDLFATYLRERADGWSPRTVVMRKHSFRILRGLGICDLGQLDREMVTRYREHLMATLSSPHSVNIHLRNLRAFANWIAEEGAPGWKGPRVHEIKAAGAEHRDALWPEELERVIASARTIYLHGDQVGLFFAFLAATGMRRGEGLACEWTWVRGNTIHIPPRTKTGRKRFVPVTARLQQILDELPGNRTGKLFPRFSDEVTPLFKCACELAGIDRRLHLHNLRDTYIVNALKAGVPAFMVARIVGNSVAVIEAHYANLVGDDFKLVGELLDKVSRETCP